MGAHDHRQKAKSEARGRCAVLTVSDSKTADTDTSGKAAAEILRAAGHEVIRHEFVPNDLVRVRSAVEAALAEADLVVTVGGTGASRRDLSVEAVQPLIAKELPGFGELFRARSVPQIGTAAILSRALLGVTASGRIVTALPGSEGAVRLALGEILVPELPHLLWELRRYA
jgi:molybdenum cofactor biosynthesis protein B